VAFSAFHCIPVRSTKKADPEDPQQAWAVRMDRLLRDLHTTVQRARAAGDDWLEPSELAGYRAAYTQNGSSISMQ